MTLFWPVARVVETGSLCGAGVRKKRSSTFQTQKAIQERENENVKSSRDFHERKRHRQSKTRISLVSG